MCLFNSFSVYQTPDGEYVATMVNPGRVPGSYAVYTKHVDANGNTIGAYKTTFDPSGEIVHVKDKMN